MPSGCNPRRAPLSSRSGWARWSSAARDEGSAGHSRAGKGPECYTQYTIKIERWQRLARSWLVGVDVNVLWGRGSQSRGRGLSECQTARRHLLDFPLRSAFTHS